MEGEHTKSPFEAVFDNKLLEVEQIFAIQDLRLKIGQVILDREEAEAKLKRHEEDRKLRMNSYHMTGGGD